MLFIEGERSGRHFSGYSFVADDKRVTRPWVREPTASQVSARERAHNARNSNIKTGGDAL